MEPIGLLLPVSDDTWFETGSQLNIFGDSLLLRLDGEVDAVHLIGECGRLMVQLDADLWDPGDDPEHKQTTTGWFHLQLMGQQRGAEVLLRALHGAVLQSQSIPVQLLSGLTAPPPAAGRPAGLQGLLAGGGVATSASPAQEDAAAAVAAQHHFHTRHLEQHTHAQQQSLLPFLSRSRTHTSAYLHFLTNVFGFSHKAEAVASGFPW